MFKLKWLFGHPGERLGDGRSQGYFWKRFVYDVSFDILMYFLKLEWVKKLGVVQEEEYCREA